MVHGGRTSASLLTPASVGRPISPTKTHPDRPILSCRFRDAREALGGVCPHAGWFAAFAGSLLWATPASAASEAALGPTLSVAGIALSLGAGYLVLRIGLARARKALPFAPGAEHLLLGAMLGPVAFGIGLFGDLRALVPLAALAAAWVAFACGVDFNLRALANLPRGGPRLGVLSGVLCGGVVTVASRLAISSWSPEVDPQRAWLISGWLGCAAAATSTAPFRVLRQRYDTGEVTATLLGHSARFSNLVAVVGFGVLACVFQAGSEWEERSLSPVELAVVAVGLGAALGLVLSPYLGQAESLAGRILLLVGVVAFTSGAASWFGLSPLWVNLALGLVLINTSLSSERVLEATRTATPALSFLLLVFAGALWVPPPWLPTLVVAGGFILLRLLARIFASWLVAQWIPQMRSDAGRGLLGQGEVAVALAIALRTTQEGPLVDIGYTAVLISVVVHDLLAPWALRGLLLDAGELRSPAEGKL